MNYVIKRNKRVMLTIHHSVKDSWDSHRTLWSRCKLCPLHASSLKRVLVRGMLPCDILFIGEATGKDENLYGFPFVGRAGVLLDTMLAETYAECGPFRYAITNTVACLPLDSDQKIRQPTPAERRVCDPRLLDLIRNVAMPLKIICVGRVSQAAILRESMVGSLASITIDSLVHPAWILRQGGVSSKAFRDATADLIKIIKGKL